MNKDILNTGAQDFIINNLHTDIMSILFKKSNFDSITSKELVEQIESKKKSKKKLPTWFKTSNIYYPNKLNIEQTSSEAAARYKAKIVSGKSLIDLTGGFGIDSYFFSQKMASVLYLEIDGDLAKIASHNFKVLDAKNIKTFNCNGLQFLRDSNKQFDWLYLDPSRRNNSKGKVFHLSDCLPDVTKNLDLLFSRSNNILIKSAPFLDISAGIKDLANNLELHIVAINGEVKELLWVLKKDHIGAIQVKTANITNKGAETFHFLLHNEKEASSSFSLPLNYLYEPNAAIMKSGAFKLIGNYFSLDKIHKHTHLYTSEKLIDFPGRRFVIKECLPYDKKASFLLKGLQANIATRNFPKTVADLKKKHKIKDGGITYLFFVTNSKGKLCFIHCERFGEDKID